MKTIWKTTLATAVLLAAAATQAAPMPPLHHEGDVAWTSGGIGRDESRALQHAAGQWPLTLEFAVQDGRHADFVADVHVHVRDAEGRTVLRATADGPLLLARLAPGRYTVDARFGEREIQRAVLIEPGAHVRQVFEWPQADLHRAG